ncbi:MAG: Sfum_1244 family protein [Gammaproteobacteria bacterium]
MGTTTDSMLAPADEALRQTVQFNCDVADARGGADFTLCIYLLKMREFYRWEQGEPVSARLPRESVGNWLSERESYLESLEDRDFAPITLDGRPFDVFDTDAINEHLVPRGLVYSGGMGRGGKPHFFLGELERREHHGEFTLLISARELARDLTSPPAMAQRDTIFVRRESLRRMLWEKVDGWNWSKPRNAMSRALAQYDLETDLEGSLDRMTEQQLEAMVLHEIGEVRAGERLGPGWGEMMLDLHHSRAEQVSRAVRDNLADCISTLPAILDAADPAGIHFFMAHLTPMRTTLFPALEGAYETWMVSGDDAALRRCADEGAQHWLTLARAFMAQHHEHGAEARTAIADMADVADNLVLR